MVNDGTAGGTATRVADCVVYRHLWTAPELDGLFAERERLQRWLDVLAALARAQATLGIIPAGSARTITEHADAERLDLSRVAAQTRRTGHSTLGLIQELQLLVPDAAREHVYYGATVQDVTDTWFGLVLRDVGALVAARSRAVAGALVGLAAAHRDTVMVGRTHGQPGAPITFGFKVAGWIDESGRHLDRLRAGRPRWSVGQLAGAVGVLGFFDGDGSSCARGSVPSSGWRPGHLLADRRDRIAEFAHVLAMVCATLARIGGEIYELSAPGDRRAARDPPGRRGQQHHHAAQAQPRGQRTPRHALPTRPRSLRPAARRDGPAARA